MYIFYLFFQFTMIPETTKDPGSICTIASASRVFLICIILPVTFIQSIFLPLSEFHIMILFRYCSLGYMRCYLIIFLRIPAFF